MPIKRLANGIWEITLENGSFWAGETHWVTPDGAFHPDLASAEKRIKQTEGKL